MLVGDSLGDKSSSNPGNRMIRTQDLILKVCKSTLWAWRATGRGHQRRSNKVELLSCTPAAGSDLGVAGVL